MCRHTDKTRFLVVPAHFASPDLPAHCAGARYTQQGVDAREIFFRSHPHLRRPLRAALSDTRTSVGEGRGREVRGLERRLRAEEVLAPL